MHGTSHMNRPLFAPLHLPSTLPRRLTQPLLVEEDVQWPCGTTKGSNANPGQKNPNKTHGTVPAHGAKRSARDGAAPKTQVHVPSVTAGSLVPPDALYRPQAQTVAWPLRRSHEGWYVTLHHLGGGGGRWHVALVYCSRLQLAAPIGRSLFAALPLYPFPP